MRPSFLGAPRPDPEVLHFYPLPSYKAEAWKQFQRIDPDEKLFAEIMDELQVQLTNRLVRYWPYPATWLGQKSWFNNTQR